MNLLAEATDRKIDRVLEALSLLDEKVERHQAENRSEFSETRSMIKISYTSLDQRLTSLENRVDRIETLLSAENRQ